MMDTKKLIIPNDLLVREAIEMLREGREVTLKAVGRSMHPYIRDQRDILVLKRCVDADIKVGNTVLAYTSDRRYVVHRIIKTETSFVILKGDGNLYGTETCKNEDVYGMLIAIERDGRRIYCNTPYQRLRAALMRWTYRTPRKIKHQIKKILKPKKSQL